MYIKYICIVKKDACKKINSLKATLTFIAVVIL